MELVDVFEEMFDTKILRILSLFFDNEDKQYYLREASRLTKVPAATTYRILVKLVKLEILSVSEIKTLKQYQLAKNKKTEFLKTIIKKEKRVLDHFVELVSSVEGVEEIILHGKQKDKRANLLILGSNIDPNQIKLVCAEVKDKYDFTLLTLTLTREQYEQMSTMGLYAGEKQTMFRSRQ